MKYQVSITLIILSFVSCHKDLSPVTNEPSVYFTGNKNNGMYEFKVVNNSDESVWYSAYSINNPAPRYSTFAGKKWHDESPGWWCSTGLTLQRFEFKPGESFSLLLTRPRINRPWRIGIQFFTSGDNDKYVWSQKVY